MLSAFLPTTLSPFGTSLCRANKVGWTGLGHINQEIGRKNIEGTLERRGMRDGAIFLNIYRSERDEKRWVVGFGRGRDSVAFSLKFQAMWG